MGLVLDSSVLIGAERKARPVSDLLEAIRASIGVTEILLSAISVIQLEHGLWRAKTPEIVERRRLYLDGVFEAIPVHPFTKEMGQLAAKVDAKARQQGLAIPFADLQIGVTALHLRLRTWHPERAPLPDDSGAAGAATLTRVTAIHSLGTTVAVVT